MDRWVSREAPLLAAELGVSEGVVWRLLRKRVNRLQKELSELDWTGPWRNGWRTRRTTGADPARTIDPRRERARAGEPVKRKSSSGGSAISRAELRNDRR